MIRIGLFSMVLTIGTLAQRVSQQESISTADSMLPVGISARRFSEAPAGVSAELYAGAPSTTSGASLIQPSVDALASVLAGVQTQLPNTGAIARLPNGLTMNIPLTGSPYGPLMSIDAVGAAATTAALNRNPALALALREQSTMRLKLAQRIAYLENAVNDRVRHVTAALLQLQQAQHALRTSQRDAFLVRTQLAQAHRQLAALDINARRLGDRAQLTDLQRALSLTQSTLDAGSVLTETQRVLNAQLAASLQDRITSMKARLGTATDKIDVILSGNTTEDATRMFQKAESLEDQASRLFQQAWDTRLAAERATIVRAHVLTDDAEDSIVRAGEAAVKKVTAAATSPSPVAKPAAAAAAARFASEETSGSDEDKSNGVATANGASGSTDNSSPDEEKNENKRSSTLRGA